MSLFEAILMIINLFINEEYISHLNFGTANQLCLKLDYIQIPPIQCLRRRVWQKV